MTTATPSQSLPQEQQEPEGFSINRRTRTLIIIGLCLLFFALIGLGSVLIGETGLQTNLEARNQAPSWAHPLGTDWLGRDMLTRTLMGLTLSLRVGLIAASISAIIGAGLGLAAAIFGGIVDTFVTSLVDLFQSLPHLILLILISFALGGGLTGVLIAVGITHWPSLARVIRAEALQIKSSDYVQISRKLGHSSWWIGRNHMLPHIVPQFLVGLILTFPHAILHEAALSFIGIGLSPHTPAIGIILSESMRHLSTGYWWLGVFPGLALLIAVKAFDILGNNFSALIDPKLSQE